MFALAETVHEIESLLDQLFEAGGNLSGQLVRARRANRLSSVVTPDIHRAFAETVTNVAAAHGSVARGHKLLSAVAGKFGIDISMFGDGRKPSDFAPNTSG